MNCMMAKRHRILLSVLALFLIGACSRNEEIEQQTSPSGGVEVAILCDNTKEPQIYSLPDGTRTWIDDNDWASTRWDKNDKIALWATARRQQLYAQRPAFLAGLLHPQLFDRRFQLDGRRYAGRNLYLHGRQPGARKRQRHAGILPNSGRTDGPLRGKMGYSGRRSADRRRASPVRTVRPNARNSAVARAALPSQMPRTANRSPCRSQHLGRTDHTTGHRFSDRSRRNPFRSTLPILRPQCPWPKARRASRSIWPLR